MMEEEIRNESVGLLEKAVSGGKALEKSREIFGTTPDYLLKDSEEE
jgi:hypothetical protein